MGKSLVTTLLKRHVNIYSDLYTLCFLRSYVQSPCLGLGPRATPPASRLCVPTLGYQVFGQQSKLVSASISHWHYPLEQRSPSAEARALTTPTPSSRCSPRACRQNTGTWAAQSRRDQCRITQSARARGRLGPHCPTLEAAGRGSWSKVWQAT